MDTVVPPDGAAAHVIVLGNEKGGTGKSTTAVHLIVALLKSGLKVAAVDTDSRQRSLARYFANRASWAAGKGVALELPELHVVELGRAERVRDIEEQEFTAYVEVIERVEHHVDVVVVDTPASDSYLMRLSHSMADTLVTPVNDSLIDLDALGHSDGGGGVEPSHYSELVTGAIRHRALADGKSTDWLVVRNRIGSFATRNQRDVIATLQRMSGAFGFRIADGISERVIFRELFARGLTVLDTLDRETLGFEPTLSHVAARREIRDLVGSLRLRAGRPLPPPAEQTTAAVPLAPVLPEELLVV
jgi:chromosome partitioning protein